MELSTYALEPFRESGEFLYYRGRRDAAPSNILVVTPSSKHSAQTAVKRLEREYSLRPRLDPAWAIVPLALVREAGKTSLVLEDPGGQPLDAVLGRPLDLTEFLRIGIGLAKALGKLHERGIVHRDINPANIRVNLTAARVWLTSFGIASDPVLEHQATDRPESADGDLAYIAPEQTGRLNRPIDRQSDLYSLGVTLYKMLTGTLPFTASEPIDWVHCHIARQPAAPEKWRKEIPPALSGIVLKLLAKTPEERYQTAVGLEADLKRCLDELESLGRIKAFVLGTQDLSDRLSIPEKLYGRDRESEVLLEAFERVSASGNSEIVLVSGYSGIGKSSVVSGLRKTIVSSRGIFAAGKFDQYKPDVPYATIAQAFQTLIRQILGKDEAEVVFWRDAIRRAVDPNGQLMVNLVPELELVIGKQEPVPDLPAQDADNRFQRVFRAFLGVFARSEHPLALFVDDLQWLDSATLKLLENLIADPELRHLLLIGAYRDNEVGPSHPLRRMLDSMRKNGARAQEITLRSLCLDDVARLISASLHRERSAAEPLDLLIHGKTGGNPFFVIQFLTAMVEERLIEFDPRQPAWRWDIDRIRARGITDNVADLLIQKLYRLPAGTRDALKQLACLGSSATTATLTVLSKGSDTEVHANLRPAIREGCVVRQENSYTFIHDRIQEATYSLIPAEDRAAAHLQIGRLLLASTAAEDLDEQIFEIVGQFNHGTHLIKSADERQRLAQLNLMAGQRARASGAHALALKYFSVGSGLLARDSWTRQYELTFSLEFRRAESEFVTGDLEAADERLAILSHQARGIVDNAAVTCLGLDLYTTIYRSDRAVEICLEYLKRLDISWSPHPTDQEVVDEYERMWRSLRNRPIEDLINLPAMTDPEWSATMDVLAKVIPPAMVTDKNLQCLVVGRMASLSLERGNCDGSCLGYVCLGGILGSHFGNYQAGFRFGKLSIELMEKRGLNRFSARVYLSFASLVNFWTQHLRTGFALVRRAFDAAQEAGDLTYATYARYDLIGQLLLSGDPLAEVQREAELAVQLAKKARFGPMVDGTTVQLRLIRMLRGLTPEFGSFNDEQFDEAQFEQRLEGDAHLANSACRYWIRKLEAQFYAARYGPAVDAAENAQRFLWAMPPTIELTDYHFHAALARAAYCREASAVERRRQMEALVAHHRQLTIWAENCPMNFGNYAALIGAEIARIEGRQLDAERLYEEAIQSAHKNGFVNNEAITNELAAKFYLDRGLGTIAHNYLRNACSCYLRWGADAKVEHLEQLYGRVEDTALELVSTTEPLLDRLDLRMVVKAFQAVSREINLGKLIETLMVTALEHAGAERGLLILSSGNEQRIAAEAKTVREIVTVDLRQTILTSTDVPESILRYVSRMQKGLILNDASVHNLFSDDEYLRRRNCRSILCVPLLKQGELAGFLYLENNLTPHVFTPERLAVLELLASQAAISLENAQLYAGLRRENTDRGKAEQSLRASEERWRRLFENSSAGIALIDSEGRYITANLALQRMLGYTEAELQGLAVSEITHEEDRARTEEILAETIAGERREYRIEKRYRRKDAGIVWADVSTVFVPATKDMPAFFSAVVVDVTERKQAETEARKHREELAHLSRVAMMGEMAGSLAHELNQPLTGIVNYASAGRRFIAKGRGEMSKLDGLFEAVVEDGRRAGEIIRGIRGMVQKGKETRGPVDINDLIAAVLRLVHSDALEHNCLLMTDLELESPFVEGDKVQLQQVLLNLIVNAFEAMTETPVKQRRVIIKERQSDGRAIVSVRDFGAGLPMGEPQRIFDQFFSTKRNGMGMGLAIVRSIIVSHDGELGAENAEGGGARVHFSLPIMRRAKEVEANS